MGKSTVLGALLAGREDLYFSVSATTRAPRAGEQDGVQYHFLSRETFQQWIDQGEFLEYAEYVGCFYGTPRRYVDQAAAQGRDTLLDIEVQGAAQVVRQRPDAVRVFLAPPSWAELERRLSARGTDTPEKIQQRLRRAREEFQSAGAYDYVVINDTVDNAVRELSAILTAEHCRPAERVEALSGREGETARETEPPHKEMNGG